jgi:hypothetical protein
LRGTSDLLRSSDDRGAAPRLVSPGMADLVESLMNATGVVAVARAAGATAGGEEAPGEPPYLVYYRGSLEAGEIRGLGFEGEVSEPGAWGRLLNGGASLEVEGRRVEVLYRDLEVVEHWVAEASEGRYERDEVDGWVTGMPTYVLAGELASAEALAGELPRPELPDALRDSAPEDWERVAARALEVAEGLAARGDVAACAGLLAKAAIAAAQARLVARGEWALSEAGIVRRAGLGRAESIIAATGDRPLDLERAVSRMRVALGVAGGRL